MANKVKQKTISLDGSIKTKSVDGERRVVFVASSANQDRHYEKVSVASLRLPLKGGGDITVEAIPKEGLADIVDIPLMLNHSGDVRDVIGSIRNAYFQNGELIFEAGISSREVAQEMLTLIEEGHLSNAFSITMIDYDYNFETETISKAEVIEVSLVYRGSNKEARLVAIKSLIGEEMSEAIEKQNDTFGDANGDGVDHTHENASIAEDKATEATKTEVEETKEEAKEEAPENKSNEEENTAMNKQIAKDEVVEKATQPIQSVKSSTYLNTKAALKDFKDTVLKFHRGSNEQIMKNWTDQLKEKALTGDAILPSRIEQIFFKTWTDNPGILGTFRMLNVKAASVYAIGTEDTAQGHKKGDKKDDQTLDALRRDIKALAIYKKLPIDLQDLFDDETGELLAFRVEELADRVANAIAIGAIFGQGTGDKATLQGTRGLYPMVTDINTATGYAKNVAIKVTAETDDTEYEIAVRAIDAVKDKGVGKILVVPTGFMTKLRLAKTSTGSLKFPVGVDMVSTIGAKAIFELDEMVGNDLKAIAYADKSYVLSGEANPTVRTDFDLTVNQDVMLIERVVGGSQQGYKTLAGVVAA